MYRLLPGAVVGVLSLLLTTPLAFGRGGGGHGGGGHGGGFHGGGFHGHMGARNPGARSFRAVGARRPGLARRPSLARRPTLRRPTLRRPGLVRRPGFGRGRWRPVVVVGSGSGVVLNGTGNAYNGADNDAIVNGDNNGNNTNGDLPWQTVRYLRINNQSGETLRVSAQLPDDAEPRTWEFAPGETGYLALGEGKRLAAAELWLWAEGGGRTWNNNKDEPLVLVPEDYQAEDIDTFNYTFNP